MQHNASQHNPKVNTDDEVWGMAILAQTGIV